LERRSLVGVRSAVAKLPAPPPLEDALVICLLLLDQEPDRYQRGAVRWLALPGCVCGGRTETACQRHRIERILRSRHRRMEVDEAMQRVAISAQFEGEAPEPSGTPPQTTRGLRAVLSKP
jgi:hypothetical protein